MKKKYFGVLILVILCWLMMTILLSSQVVFHEFLTYSNLFLTKLFPASFLFFVLARLLLDYQIIEIIEHIFKVSSVYFYLFVISLISGFPSGAVFIRQLLLNNKIDQDMANQMILYAHFPNPLFVLSSVSSILNSTIAWKIYFSIVFSNFILFLFLPKKKNSYQSFIHFPSSFSSCFSRAIKEAIDVLLIIYGTSIFFTLIAFFFCSFIQNSYLFVLVNGVFDLTKGVFSTSILSSSFLKSFFILFFLSFGSLSIHFQIKSILSDTSVSYFSFLKGRVLGCLFSLFFFFLLNLL